MCIFPISPDVLTVKVLLKISHGKIVNLYVDIYEVVENLYPRQSSSALYLFDVGLKPH